MKIRNVSRIASAVLLGLGMSTAAFAADTSSALRGKIVGPQGNPAANVTVKVIHTPTGSVKEIKTSYDGTISARGLRVGGPYKLVIDSDKFQDAELNNVFLSLGDTFRFEQQLESLDIETIAVVGHKMSFEVGGSNSVFGEDTINNTPSFNRDVKDIARLNPMVSIRGNGEMSIAGGNPRSNSFTVDGISQNDDLGLNFGGYPTQQPPVSLNALEQVSVDTSPFSAKKGKFGGGAINAVTKSGTNEFKFSGYYETTTPELSGDIKSVSADSFPRFDTEEEWQQYLTDNAERLSAINPDYPESASQGRRILDQDGHRTYSVEESEPNTTETRWGFNVGGALLEDELFYFVDYTEWSRSSDITYGFEGSGASNEFNVTQEQFDNFNQALATNYGLTDSLPSSPEDTDKSLLTKLSWNINEAHRADFTYQWKEGVDDRGVSGGGNTVSLDSTTYAYVTKFNNYAAKLYSYWTSDFSTEIGVSYKDVKQTSETKSDIGDVTVYLKDGRGENFSFGRDYDRHLNEASTETFIVSLDATYYLDFMGEHEINFGGQYERARLYNAYARGSLGSWTFDSFTDFQDRKLANPLDFSYANAYTNDATDVGYDATRSQLSLYAEDKFYATDDVEITAGLRYELLMADDEPALNEDFEERYGFSNQENLDGLDIILPRLGVTWTVTDDLTIRGGIGRFQGGEPNVWFNNPFQYDGLTYVSALRDDIEDYYGDDNNPNRTVENFQVPQQIQDSMQQGNGWIAYNDPNFKMPSTWRAQIGFDLNFDVPGLGDDFVWTNEAIYKVDKDQAVWLNTTLEPIVNEDGSLLTAADGERLIQRSTRGNTLYDIMMTNAEDDPRSIILSTALSKSWDNGLRMSMSYTNQNIEDVHVGSASNVDGNYKHSVVVNRNQIDAARGSYENEHSLKVTLGYTTEFFAGYQTRFNAFFERRSGRPFSYTMPFYRDGDLGDNYEFNGTQAYLPYIPTGADDPNVNWSDSGLSWAELEPLLDRAGITERGEILGRNTGTMPWLTTLDVSVHQEIPGIREGHKGEVYFMIDNFANLLNDDWGIERDMRYFNQAIYDFGGLDDQGRYKIDRRYGDFDVRNYSQIDRASSWQVKVGVSYKF